MGVRVAFRPEAVFFDWDGTLVDTFTLLHQAHNHVRETLGWPLLDREGAEDAIRRSARDLFPAVFGMQADRAMELFYGFVHTRHLEFLRAIPGAEAALTRAAHVTEGRVAIVSNKRHDLLLREIQALGWGGLTSVCVGAGLAARDKPAPDPVFLAARQFTAPAEISRSLFIGDTQTDLDCAQSAGCPVVLVGHGQVEPGGLFLGYARALADIQFSS